MTALSPDDETLSPELAPRRMLDGGAGEPERLLLAAARLDRVPGGAKARVAAALGGVLEPQVAPSARAPELERAAGGDSLSRLGTRSALGVVGVGIVGAIALSLWLRSTPKASSDGVFTPRGPVPVANTAHLEGAPAAAAEPSHAAQAAPTERAEHALREVPPRHDGSEPQRARRQAARSHAEPVDSGLLAEVRALEAVSTAIDAGQPGRAARELAAYRRRFAQGELAIEADVLAIQIAVARGDRETASAGAERLLARPEADHYRARVRALLDGNKALAGSTDEQNVERGRSNDAAAHIRARR
jgi:hypothetical protein